MRLLTTTNFAMDTFIIFCLAFQVTEALDKLLAFRESNNNYWTLVCTAKDNGDAFVWNTDSNWDSDTTFKSTYTEKYNNQSCSKLNICKWHVEKWKSTDWKQNPMGPVLDSRWEDFREYDNFKFLNKYAYIDKLPKKGALAFSIRGTMDAHFLLCENKSYQDSFCYWITIQDQKEAETYLQVCEQGTEIWTWYKGYSQSPCKVFGNRYKNKTQLSPTEWKHFVLTWNGDTGNTTLYDDKKQLITYHYDKPIANLIEFHLFHKSPNLMRIRYHNYTFHHTKRQTDVLDSMWLYLQNNNLCFRTSIGLCAKCSMNVSLYTSNGFQYTETLKTVNGTTTKEGLPAWQYVEFNMIVLNSSIGKQVAVRINPIIKDGNDTEGFWAVSNFKACPPPDTMKIGRMTNDVSSKFVTKNNPLPNVTCQRISYTRNEVVRANIIADALEIDEYDCPNGILCSMSCKSFYKKFNESCRDIAICDAKGCTCQIGFMGDNCNEQCDFGKYGYMCYKTCGRCLDKPCDYKTGLCTNDTCDNKDVYHIPPYCDIEIHTPPAPTMISIDQTSVRVSIPARDEYKKTTMEYTFIIKNAKATTEEVLTYKPIFRNTTTLEMTIDTLKPGTYYRILCSLKIKNEDSVINGVSLMFKTSCTVNTDFKIDTGATNLTVTASNQETILYPCPFNLYHITIQDCGTLETIRKERLLKMPFTLKELEPNTNYEVVISNEENLNNTLTTVRTKEGISSQVENIYYDIRNDTIVYLQWSKPKKTNGIIKEYEIIVNITTYFGCLALKRDTRPSEFLRTRTNVTNITLFDLQPYAKYIAIIYAWNSNRGEAASVNVSTNATEIPRSSFSNLRKEDHKLIWDNPKDCSTISGPIKVSRLEFVGVSMAVKNYERVVKQTSRTSFDIMIPQLYGKETYKVFVYPLRDYHKKHNSSTYVDLEFDTPAKAPSQVRNLEIVEVDYRINSILLRWQEPFPPNGKIDHYSVAKCDYKTCTFYNKNVSKSNYCPLWKNYICETIKEDFTKELNIIVYGINENVKNDGEYASIIIPMYNSSEHASDRPENVTVRVNHNKTVTLSWLHPYRTRLPLKKFFIRTHINHSQLRQQIYETEVDNVYSYPINNYKQEYTMILDLIPSTRYEIFISPITIDENYGESNIIFFETSASLAFEGNLTYTFQSETMICLHIPTVIHDTKSSTIYFVVKGKNPCKGYVKLDQFLETYANVKSDEIAWLAGSFPASKYVGKEFCVGDNTTSPENCPLSREKYYYTVIVIVRADENSTNDEVAVASVTDGTPRRHDELWIVPVVMIIIVGAFIFFLRKRPIHMIPREVITHKNISIIYKSKEVLPATPNLSENNRFLCESTTDIASFSTEAILNDDKDSLIPIKVKDFEDYVKNAVKSGLLKKQYEMFPRGLTMPSDYGKLPQNIPKNRYRNLVAYDETRVILEKLQDDPFSDYINANYIKGYKMEKRYIATQGPKPNTIIDFWRMIWQENVLVICMLANVAEHGKVKCERYWPDIGKKKKYGDVKVFNVEHNVFADYTFRILHVTYDGETRQVKHLHYTTWPDHGVPMYTHSAVTYLNKLLATQTGSGPVVVHCSAGVGRTGTIILCDICLRRAAAEGVVDVFSETQSIRSQRVNMVDNKQQYLFAHLILVECLLALPTSIPCDHDFSTRIKDMKTQSNEQFQRLKDTTWQDEALRPTIDRTILSECNIAKHRYPELISDKVGRIYLKKYPRHVEDSDYIAAVYVDGLTMQNQYLASQLPLPSTFIDFWRMITEFNVKLVVVLQPPDPDDPTCCPIVPTENEFKPTPYMNVITKNIVEHEYYVLHTLKIVDNSKKVEPEQSITILTSTKYEAGRNKDPPSVDALVNLWQASGRIARDDSPTVVLCHDGVTGCGLYLALSCLLERMAIERECDVCLAIRIVKRSRPDFVRSIEQMEYLYDAALNYAEYFTTYANFT